MTSIRKLSRWLCLTVVATASIARAQTSDTTLKAGFRGSNIRNYPSEYWAYVADTMSHNFTRPAVGAGVWIVSFYGTGGFTYVQFPSDGAAYPHISFAPNERNESYLNYFDQRNIKIWLQVEPGAADVDTLIDIVLRRYRHHRCVAGFGIDVEWLDAQSFSGGRQVTDGEAPRWENRVRSYDTAYTFFLKHYVRNRMPPGYRGQIMYIDDSQGFSGGLTQMVNEFRGWGAAFPENPVGFQVGYPRDSTWWRTFPNPPREIGNTLLAAIPNCRSLIWVDFTVTRVFPWNPVDVARVQPATPHTAMLLQNYPNPFNPSTVIPFRVSSFGFVSLKVFDVLGREVATLVNEELRPGSYRRTFSITGRQASGVYCYQLRTGVFSETKRLLLLR